MTRKPTKRPEARRIVKRLPAVRVNPDDLTEDEADYLFYLKHKGEKLFDLDEVLRVGHRGDVYRRF